MQFFLHICSKNDLWLYPRKFRQVRLHENGAWVELPCNYLINYLLLFGGGAAEIDTRSFYAFMPH